MEKKFIYEVPAVEVMEMAAEGSYCVTSSGNHEGAGDGGDLWPNA